MKHDLAQRAATNIRNYARRIRQIVARQNEIPGASATEIYSRRVEVETQFFGGCRDAHELPAIYHYWSNKFLRPKLERLGVSDPEALFRHYLALAYVGSPNEQRTFVSVGSGLCDTEIRLAEDLVSRGHENFTFECLELNRELLDRGQALAREKGVGRYIVPVRGDFNKWVPAKIYDGVVANSSLHHVMNLEELLSNIRRSLAPTGFFVTCDTIGRNGHMRWPEALDIVQEFWRELPREYTCNNLLNRYEASYENWDCSIDGFEGIRAQDILPLLIEHFHFDFFVTFGNVIDPFIDRAFGHNFKASNEWDVAFIDRVHARDEAEMARGAIKPTHILAAMCTVPSARPIFDEGFPPNFCVRWPQRPPVAIAQLPIPANTMEMPDPAYSIALVPANPSSFAPAVARIGLPRLSTRTVEKTSTRFDGRAIRIHIDDERGVDSAEPKSSGTIDVRLGQLPAGTYVAAVDLGKRRSVATCTFRVVEGIAANQSIRPLVDYTDMWWNPQESGWGLSIHQHASDLLFATWLTYGPNGEPIWYSLEPGQWTGASTFSGPIYVNDGPLQGQPFSTETVKSSEVGTAVLTFTDHANGTFSYTSLGVTVAKRIVRMYY